MTATRRGSSPLTRGKRSRVRLSSLVAGLIPAHAGKTRMRTLSISPSRAHPRSRGENAKKFMLATPVPGSSPLTRGKLREVAQLHERRGLIPAHAGKTSRTRPRARCARAHPRSRGENGVPLLAPSYGAGSSPLTRGKRSRGSPRPLTVRLIPAHAGKTQGIPTP